MTGQFSVDVAELEVLARDFVAVADDVRDHVAWKFEIDVERWPHTDPMRAAVIRYQGSLRGAVDRLCGGAERIASSLNAIAASYRGIDADLAARLDQLAADTQAGSTTGTGAVAQLRGTLAEHQVAADTLLARLAGVATEAGDPRGRAATNP